MKIKLGDKDYEFKELKTARDWMDIQTPEVKEQTMMTIGLVSQMSIKPKLSKEKILNFPLKDFFELMRQITPQFQIDVDFLGTP